MILSYIIRRNLLLYVCVCVFSISAARSKCWRAQRSCCQAGGEEGRGHFAGRAVLSGIVHEYMSEMKCKEMNIQPQEYVEFAYYSDDNITAHEII